MIVLAITIPLAAVLDFRNTQPDFALVKIGNFWESVGINASFEGIATFPFWKYVFMFLFVNSLESLLTVKAIDGLDPYRRKSNYNTDLSALGLGNGISGLLGGLPMISEVVRSSANVNFGARTRWSNVFHGLFLFLAMLLMIPVIEMIPNAALAGMLIFAGYRLASPKEFIGTYKIGPEQLVIFLVTILVTVAEDLLLGVFAGIIVKLIFHVVNGAPLRSLFKADYDLEETEAGYSIKVKGAATFSNFLGYKKLWATFKPERTVIFNFADTRLVDHSFMEQLHHFEEDYHHTGGKVAWEGLEKFSPYSNHPLAARKVTKDADRKIEIRLDDRQVDLRIFSDLHDFVFYPQKVRNNIKYKDFPILKGSRILYEENLLTRYEEYGKVDISDLKIAEGAGMAKEEKVVTVVYVSDLDFSIPDVALEPERMWTKFSELTFAKDIDFKNHDQFSRKYYLRGDNEGAIREFFSESLLEFLEKQQDLHIESHKNKLLIYAKREVLDTSELVQLLSVVPKLIESMTEAAHS